MDAQQKQSIIRHISQKIFINKVSKQKFMGLLVEDDRVIKTYAREALICAKIFVEELEIEMKDQHEADVLT